MPLWLEPPIISAATIRMMVTPMPSCRPGENARHRGGDHHLELDLPRVGAEILGRLDQSAVDLADAGIGADHDREERRDRADDDAVGLAGAEPDDQQRNQRNLRQRIERGDPDVGDARDDARHAHQQAKRDAGHCGDAGSRRRCAAA